MLQGDFVCVLMKNLVAGGCLFMVELAVKFVPKFCHKEGNLENEFEIAKIWGYKSVVWLFVSPWGLPAMNSKVKSKIQRISESSIWNKQWQSG